MSGLRDLAKGGWHPKGKGTGGKESWRSDFKGVNTVAGWMGKGKDPNQAEREQHVSAPLSTLKDPASFGPPPKHINYHGATAVSSPSSSTADAGGLGSPVTRDEMTARERTQARREAEAGAEQEASRPPSGPYRVDTTGLSTAHLPKPPAFRPGQTPPPTSEAIKPKPKLPPRLPPRQNSHPDAYSQPPPPPYSEIAADSTGGQEYLNQGALDRLGKAGLSVPGLNIGPNASPPIPPRRNASPSNTPTSPAVTGNNGVQLSELQSRFAKMSSQSHDSSASAPEGTSWADKQAALKTANKLHDDPSNVSLSDMTSAASTANNFRERHGEQAAAGWRAAHGLNQKHGIADRIKGNVSPTSPGSLPLPPQSPIKGIVGKKPPPPPPPKKKDPSNSSSEPPPIPLASKPKF